MRRSYLFLLLLVLLFARADNAMAAYYDDHTGDSWDDAYIISTAQDMKDMRERSYSYLTDTKYYKLANDISIEAVTDADWANENDSIYYYYNGYIIRLINSYFDGQGHTINVNLDTSGIIEPETSTTGMHMALFGSVINSTIVNLNVAGSVKAKSMAAGIFDDCFESTIENCSFSGTVESIGYIYRDGEGNSSGFSSAQAGGIAGSIHVSTVKNCKFSGQVSATSNNDNDNDDLYYYNSATAGGIAAAMLSNDRGLDNIIDGCTVSSNSVIYAAATGTNYNTSEAGGIAGSSTGGTIQNCVSEASVTARYAGGIVGFAFARRGATVLRNNTWPSQYPEVGHDPSAANPSAAKPSIITDSTSLPYGTVGKEYNAQLEAGGETPITFTLIDGALPDGLNLSSSGLIDGTPSKAGSKAFKIRASNSYGTDEKSLVIRVYAAQNNNNDNSNNNNDNSNSGSSKKSGGGGGGCSHGFSAAALVFIFAIAFKFKKI